MPTLAPFAALESRVNSAVFERLCNAVAALDGGPEFGVIFERPYSDPFGQSVVDAEQCQCTAPMAAVQALRQGSALTVSGVRYRVERVEPDGTGGALVILYPHA